MSERKYIYLILGIIGIFCVIYFSNTTQKFGANPRVLNEIQGGTATSTYVKGDVLYSDDANSLSSLPIGTAGQVLEVSALGLPEWDTDDSGGAGSGGGAAWEKYATNVITPTTSNAGIWVTASSTFTSDLIIGGYLRATTALDFWFNNTTTWIGFDTNWDRMFNATTTWSAFTANFNTSLNSTSTLDLTTLVTDKTTSTIGLWVGTAGNPIFSNEIGGDIFAQDDIEAGGGLFASDISTTTATTTLAGESGGGGVKIYHIDGTTTIEFL